jgi:hypothetical protein
MTYRERRLAKAERLRGWAEKREEKAETVYKEREHYAGDTAFWTQPGNIPQRTRLYAKMERTHESLKLADKMRGRAAGIEDAADRAIYSDDPDAIEQLQERIADLEGQRNRIKAFNASCRKGAPDSSLLDDAQRKEWQTLTRVCAWQMKGGAFPAYALSNLNGNISKQRDRVRQLQGLPTHVTCPACDGQTCAKCRWTGQVKA